MVRQIQSCKDIEAKKPRICGRQIMRDNVEDYFRKSITVPFLYCTLNEMKTRFTDLHARTALGLQLVPSIKRKNITLIMITNQRTALKQVPMTFLMTTVRQETQILSTESLDPPLNINTSE
jgi:hypothetical protein